jgi:CHAT domain-containing protein
MGRLRLWIIAVVSLIVVTANAWIKQGVGILLCGAIFVNSTGCYEFGLSKAVAIEPATKPILISQRRNNQISGTWTRSGTIFSGDEKGCSAGYSGELNANSQKANSVVFNVKQEGSQLIFPDEKITYNDGTEKGEYNLSTNGSISGNQIKVVYSGGGFTTLFNGNISANGETITGEVSCRYSGGSNIAKGTLTWTKGNKVAQNSSAIIPKTRPEFEEKFKQAKQTSINDAVQLVEGYGTEEYRQYLQLEDEIKDSPKIKTVKEISNTLFDIYQATGKKPAILQAVSLEDETDLILIKPTPWTAVGESGAKAGKKNTEKQNTEKQNTGKQTEEKTDIATRKTILLATRQEVKEAVADFQKEIRNPRRKLKAYETSAKKLYQWLISPIEDELQANKIDTLIITADKGLRSLPFAALYDGQKYLVEKYSLALIPTFALTDTDYQRSNNFNILAMGISKSTVGLPAIPAAGVEVDFLSQKIWKGQGFLNEETTVEQLKKVNLGSSFDIVHLATHGEFLPGEFKNSFILFWQNKLSLKTLQRLSKNIKLNKVKMLVLSACKSALGDEKAELGFSGLAINAGVKTGLGTLWSIDDKASLVLMSDFYSHLKTESLKAEALRKAQLAMLKGESAIKNGQMKLSNGESLALPQSLVEGDSEYTHPYYWAAFTLIGNWN